MKKRIVKAMRYPTVTVRKEFGSLLEKFPNAGPRCNVTGMKKLYWGENALCVRCGLYVYHVDADTYKTCGGVL